MISNLTSRRGYFARSLFITNYKTNLAENYFKNIDDRYARYLTRDKAVTYKHIYVKNVLEDAYSTLEIQNFIYPDLHIWEMMDSNAMQSIEGLRLRRCPALRPSFYKFIETVVPQIMPDYHVVRVGDLVTVKRNH
uniref:COX2_CUA domain-containing protein n=1 Tax=Panagrellus redivivus TaxID=6233 RepID=A0A7E4USC6_PANRE